MRGRNWNVAARNMPSSLFRVLVPSASQLTAYTQFDGHGYHGDTLISAHDIMFSQVCVTVPKQHTVTIAQLHPKYILQYIHKLI